MSSAFRIVTRWVWVVPCTALVLAGCNDRSRPTVPIFGDLTVLSDPPGAEIAVDGQIVGELTPATLTGVEAGQRLIELAFVPGPAEAFLWSDTVTVPEESLDTLDAALEGGCGRNCPFLVDPGRLRCRATGRGDTCADVFFDGLPALQWPGPEGGAYGAGGRLLLAGIMENGPRAGDTISTQVYAEAWIGRRPMVRSTSGRRETMRLGYWGNAAYFGDSLLGLEVSETLVAVDSATAEDVLFIHFEIHNISDDARYQRLYPGVPEEGLTYRSLYLGFGLDADVGSSEDDLGTFDTGLDLAFIYDAFFQDPELGEFAERPALVGLVAVNPPAGASQRTFTLWRRSDDWDDGDRHAFAWRLLAGRLAASDPIDDHPDSEIGHQGSEPNDYRITESFGPLDMAPGDRIEFTVALAMAEPVAGSYTPGTLVRPEDPTDPNRQIIAVAADLRALAAQVGEIWARYRP